MRYNGFELDDREVVEALRLMKKYGLLEELPCTEGSSSRSGDEERLERRSSFKEKALRAIKWINSILWLLVRIRQGF